MKKVSKCLWCGSKKIDLFTKRKDQTEILKCTKCGLYMVGSIPEDLDNYYYDETYYNANETNIDTGYAEMYDLMSPAFLFWQNSLIEELNESHENQNFLEIGCATGNLLEIISENQKNLSVEGLDISKYAVMAARSKGLNAEVGYIDEYKSKPKKDVIFSSETMEHLDDLKSFLTGVLNNLKDDGVFLFYVPSISEDDANQNKESYLRFNTNLEHLLHFTPEFIENEFGNFFNSTVYVKEIKTGYGPCIIGALSKDETKLFDLRNILECIDRENIPNNTTNIFLKNLAIISLKFGNFNLATKAHELLNSRNDVDYDTILLIEGLIGYHSGSLESSNNCFEKYLKRNPGNKFAIRLILANERELNKNYKSSLAKIKQETDILTQRLLTAEDQLRDYHKSRLIGLAIRLRPLISKIYLLIKKVPRKLKSILKIIIKKIFPDSFLLKLKYLLKLEWLVKVVVVDNNIISEQVLLSVIIPYYNMGKTIDETLDSLKNQTYKAFEVIIVNDGSTEDFSVEKIRNINLDGLNAFVVNQKNQGVAAARNNGIKIANGKYIVCLDSDDILDATYLEKELLLLESNPICDIATTNMNIFGVRNGIYTQAAYDPYKLIHDNMVITAAMFPKKAWEQVGGYKSGIGYEDWEFWINLAENGYWGRLIPEPIFNYRTAVSSRYIDDQSKHELNISVIKNLHIKYDKIINRINRNRYFNKKIIGKTPLINLQNSADYNYIKNNKPNILITMPWMTFGGAETLIYNFCREIKDDCNISFVTGLKSEHEWEYKFKEITNRIYHLANLFEDETVQLEFISNYIKTRHIHVLHVVHNGFMYSMLDELKTRHPDLKIIVTLFNDRVEYFGQAIKHAKYIDMFVSDNQKVVSSYQEKTHNKNASVIPNGVDCDTEFNPKLFNRSKQRADLGIDESDLSVFFVGRLSSEKNPNVFLDAVDDMLNIKHEKNVKFFMIGDGVMKHEVEKHISKINNSNFEYLGYQTNIAKYLSAADVFVLPSSIEGFPLSILEAMSMGVAVVASNVGAIPDVVNDKKDGFIIKPGSSMEIVESIEILNSNRKLLNEIKKLSRVKIEKHYSNTVLKSNYNKLYKEILK